MENHQFQRDKGSRALINTDKDSLKSFRLQRELANKKAQALEERFQKIENTLNDILVILKDRSNNGI